MSTLPLLGTGIDRDNAGYRVRIRLVTTSGISPCGEKGYRDEASLGHLSHSARNLVKTPRLSQRGHIRPLAYGEHKANTLLCSSAPMLPKPLTIIFSEHGITRLKERVPDGHGLAKGLVVRLILVRQQDEKRNKRWMMKLPDGVLLGKLLSTRKGENLFIVRTVLDLGMIRRQQRQLDWQFVPLDVRVFQIKNIREVHAKEKRMPTMREQISALINNNPDADYWEKLVLRLAEALLDIVDEQLRGIPREEPGLERMGFEDYENMPGRIELHDGLLAPIRWNLYQEGRHRLGYASVSEGMDSSREEILRRREALRRKPFIASQVPFPSGPPEE